MLKAGAKSNNAVISPIILRAVLGGIGATPLVAGAETEH